METDDQRIQKSLYYLRTIQLKKTYVVALQTMVFARVKLARDHELLLQNVKQRQNEQDNNSPFVGRAEPYRNHELIIRNVKWLENAQVTGGECKGAWSYGAGRRTADNSNAQFAMLALYEAERVGVSANDHTWLLAKKYWEKRQNTDGAWAYRGYRNKYNGAGSMTCAGITSLIIANDTLQASDARATGDRVECCLSSKHRDAVRIERAINWLGKHYSMTRNHSKTHFFYYLYGLERAGRLTARRFIPLPTRRSDWYREGADLLVQSQDQLAGFWTEENLKEHGRLIGTSFALLFLSKGRWPVLWAKLQHNAGQDWNRHRHDVGNLTRYVETRWLRDLTWQVIDLRLANVDDLVQIPVLYLCGSRSPLARAPADRKEQARKLRDYLDHGGFLMAEANCGGADFDKGFRDLMRDVFPEPEYKLQLLDSEHPIWHAEEKIDPRHLRPLLGIDFGCQTSVVYAPPEAPRPSLSCLWELSRPGRGVKYNSAVQAQVDAALSLGINVLAYATSRELKTKENFFPGDTTLQACDQPERGRLDVANLRHPGGCNVAPRALTNLMDSVGRELKMRTHIRSELLDLTDPDLFNYHLVFMHGRTAFRLTDSQRRQLKLFLERGGMLLADSICASRAFTESFRREMAAMFPSCKLERIPVSDPLLGKTYGGFDLRVVSRRVSKTTDRSGPFGATVRKVPPELEGIKLGDHWDVIFSQYDLSCALEEHDSLKCSGYTQRDAARIGLNVVMYSLH